LGLPAGGRWGSCPTLPYGELRLWSPVPPLDLLPLSPDWLLVVLVCLIHLFVVVCCSVWLCRNCLVYVADAFAATVPLPSDAWTPLDSMADALPSLSVCSPLWQMPFCQEHVGPLLDGCFVARGHLVYADGMLCHRYRWMLAYVSFLGGYFATTA
jgi:hypothetical protein